MRKFKILSVILAVVLLFSVIPVFTASAESAEVSDANGFIKAIADGYSVITTKGPITIMKTVEITNDLTINVDVNSDNPQMDSGIQFYCPNGYPEPFTIGFKVAPTATLTINEHSSDTKVLFEGNTCSLFLLEANEQSAAKVIINGGRVDASNSMNPSDDSCKIFKTSATAATKKPTIIINDGKFLHDISTENTNITINGGFFKNDPTQYLGKNVLVLESSSYGDEGYRVYPTAEEKSKKFNDLLNDKGELEVNYFKPSEEKIDDFCYYIWQTYSPEDGVPEFEFHTNLLDLEKETIYISLLTEKGYGETHKVKIAFAPEGDIKNEIDTIIDNVPKSNDPLNPYAFPVTDLELINYWNFYDEEGNSVDDFINFSGEFKKLFDYKNYSCYVQVGAGADAPFRTETDAIGRFCHNGIVYGAENICAAADHIIYVPSDTADTVKAKKEAAQSRIDGYLGKGKVKVEESTVFEATLYSLYNGYCRWMWEQDDPDMTFDEFMAVYEIYTGEAIDNGNIESRSDLDGVTIDTPCYKVLMNGINRYFLVKCDGTKMVEAPTYKNVDALTKVSVTTDDTSVPLDTIARAEKLTSGEEYDRVIKALGVKENATYDIKLYSESAQKFITKLENGKFQVKLPVPKELEGKELGVYYVDANGKITYHKVTVEGGFAAFETDHFSTYVLSEFINLSNGGETTSQPNTSAPAETEKSPATGNSNTCIILLLAVAFVMSAVSIKKIKE